MNINLPPEDYLNKINEVEIRINLILDELKNTYVNYKIYPDVSEYQNVYSNNKKNLDNAHNEFFLLKNYLQTNLMNQKKEIEEKGKTIDELKKENEHLNKTYKSLLLGNNAAIGLNYQQEGLYTLSKYNLILTILGILGISFVTLQAFNNFSKKTKSSESDSTVSVSRENKTESDKSNETPSQTSETSSSSSISPSETTSTSQTQKQ